MNHETAIKLLKEYAKAWGKPADYEPARWMIDAVQAAAIDEREACVKACEKVMQTIGDHGTEQAYLGAESCVFAIRAR